MVANFFYIFSSCLFLRNLHRRDSDSQFNKLSSKNCASTVSKEFVQAHRRNLFENEIYLNSSRSYSQYRCIEMNKFIHKNISRFLEIHLHASYKKKNCPLIKTWVETAPCYLGSAVLLNHDSETVETITDAVFPLLL